MSMFDQEDYSDNSSDTSESHTQVLQQQLAQITERYPELSCFKDQIEDINNDEQLEKAMDEMISVINEKTKTLSTIPLDVLRQRSSEIEGLSERAKEIILSGEMDPVLLRLSNINNTLDRFNENCTIM